MALDPQIPLAAVRGQPSFAQQAGGALQLASAIESHRDAQRQRQDQQIIQEALKGGANFATPDGIAMAAEQLKGRVTPQTYQALTKAHSEMLTNQAKQEEAYAKLQPELIEGEMKQYDFIAQSLETALSSFEIARKVKGDQAALQDFETTKNQIIQGIGAKQMPGGRPLVDPQLLQKFQGMNPAETQSALQSTNYMRERLKSVLDRQKREADIAYTQQQTRTSAAREAALKNKDTGLIWDEMSPEQQENAKTIATTWLVSGRQPPARGGAYQMGMIGAQQIAKELDMSISELMSAGAEVKSQLQARPVVEKRIQALERAENQLELEIPVMEDAMNELNLPSIPVFARGKIAVLRQMGDPGVAKLDQAADVVFNEFETVKTGNPGALYVTNMEAAKENYYKVQTPQQMKAWIAGARRIINNAKKSNEKTRQDITDHILKSLKMKRKSGAETKPEESTSVPRGAMPTGLPAGSKQIGHTPDGKPVWESPDGKRYVE